jgi:type III secretion system FlhB-like substrate exporter
METAGWTKFAVIHDNSNFSTEFANKVISEAKNRGIEITNNLRIIDTLLNEDL